MGRSAPRSEPGAWVRHTRAGDLGEAHAAVPWAEKQRVVGTARRSAAWDWSALPLGQRSTFESFSQKGGISPLPTIPWTSEVEGNHFLISKTWSDSGLTKALGRETTGAWTIPHGPRPYRLAAFLLLLPQLLTHSRQLLGSPAL